VLITEETVGGLRGHDYDVCNDQTLPGVQTAAD
jgi:hypothetical protein